MLQYLMAHKILNDKREERLSKNKLGPRVLVTGSSYSGQNVLCHILLNYALKLGWTPTFVDLDLSNEICLPGTVAATPVDFIVPNDFMVDSAFSLYHGTMLSEINLFLYEKQVAELAKAVNGKLEFELENFKKRFSLNSKSAGTREGSDQVNICSETPTYFASGVIIHCPIIEASKSHAIYRKIIEDFGVEYVFVIENEKIYNVYKNINDKFFGKTLDVSLLQKYQGINYDLQYKDYLEKARFDAYFKGPYNNVEMTEFKLYLDQYKLLNVIQSHVSSALLPIGSTSDLNLLIREVNLDDNLVNRIVAVVHLEDKVINDLDTNFNKLNSYVDTFVSAPVAFFGYM